MVEVVDKNPCAEWLASVKLGHECDQSSITVAVVPALSLWPAGPAHPPETTVTDVPPEFAELAEAPKSAMWAEAAAVAPPEAEPRQWQHAVLQS